MLIDGSSLDLCDFESQIIGDLSDAEKLDSSVHDACAQFEVILGNVLSLLPGKFPWKYWALDELYCDGFNRRDHIITLQGTPYWLAGGEECNSFRIDVDLGKDPLLYSYKFKNNKSGTQILYIGKMSDGWIVNGS